MLGQLFLHLINLNQLQKCDSLGIAISDILNKQSFLKTIFPVSLCFELLSVKGTAIH